LLKKKLAEIADSPMIPTAWITPMSDSLSDRASHLIIGSGPSGVACAHALLQLGARVVMLDAGITLEEPRRQTVAQMNAQPPKSWTQEQIKTLKNGMSSGVKGIPLKLVYGSNYPYRDADIHVPADYQGVALRPSLALGGFSAVWGAAMLPYSESDMAGWPINRADLSDHYAAVARLTGLATVHDDLEKFFPFQGSSPDLLAMSRQAKNLYARLEQNRIPLQTAGIHFGRARVAARAGPAGCVYCGLCMYGCPYGFIYNSEQTLAGLRQHPNFTYRPDAIVTRLEEVGGSVRITGYHRTSREAFEFPAQRAYLATGVLATAKIVLQSLGLYDQPVLLKDSQYYLFPLITGSGGDVQHEALHTLCQLFIEIFDDQITPHSVHLQVYTYNDLIGQAVRVAFGPAAGAFEWLARALERRLLVVQGYLHSNYSSQISVQLKKGAPDRLLVQAKLNPAVPSTVRRVLRKLRRHGRQLGAWPLAPMLQMADPGRGFHNGSSFPMRSDPAGLETDILGRLPAWKRIHIVDASVLPDIPATQITFSVMANAHRIASQAGQELD
jgi:choline dehydrogenase-like flavoprotein